MRVGAVVALDNIDVRFHEHAYFHATDTIIQAILDVFKEDVKVITYPANWREAVKEALYAWLGTGYTGHWPVMGDVLRTRWPVRHTTVDIDALYPLLVAPNQARIVYRKMTPQRERW